MTHEEFVLMYSEALQHGWVSSKDPDKAKKQKQREKEYNHDYYRKHTRGLIRSLSPKVDKIHSTYNSIYNTDLVTNASDAELVERSRARTIREHANEVSKKLEKLQAKSFSGKILVKAVNWLDEYTNKYAKKALKMIDESKKKTGSDKVRDILNNTRSALLNIYNK